MHTHTHSNMSQHTHTLTATHVFNWSAAQRPSAYKNNKSSLVEQMAHKHSHGTCVFASSPHDTGPRHIIIWTPNITDLHIFLMGIIICSSCCFVVALALCVCAGAFSQRLAADAPAHTLTHVRRDKPLIICISTLHIMHT